MDLEIDIFGGTPRDKFFDIVFNANRNLVENEIERIFCELVALRELAEEKGITNADINSFLSVNSQNLEDGLNDVYIAVTGEILSQNE